MCIVLIFERRPHGTSRFPPLWQRFLSDRSNEPIGSPVMTPLTGDSDRHSRRPLLPPRQAHSTRARFNDEVDDLRTRGIRETSATPTTPSSSIDEDRSTNILELPYSASATSVAA